MKNFIVLIVSLFCLTGIAQTATIKGKVIESQTGEDIAFCNVSLIAADSSKNYVTSDFEGSFQFKNVKPGVYRIEAVSMGYEKLVVKGITVSDKDIYQELKLEPSKMELQEIQITTVNNTSKSNKAYKPVSGKAKFRKKSEKCPAYGWSGNTPANGGFETEQYDRIYDNEFKEVSKDPLSTFSIDVDKASYSNVRRFLNENQLPPPDAVRIEEMINYFDYNYPEPKAGEPFSITTQYTDCPWNKAHQLIHIGMKSPEVKLENMPPNNLVFLLDVSGSMQDESKLPLLKAGLNLLIDEMRPEDKISIVVYAGAAGVVLQPTSGKNKEKIREALEKLEAGGSTAGGEGIMLAYKTAKENFDSKANNRVILATDGDFNVGVSSDGDLTRIIEKERESGVFLTVLGFGMGNYKDSKMEKLADKGNGNYAYIDNLLEAKKVLVKEMGGTLLTVAKDVKLQIEFNPNKVKGYRLVGYENRMLNNEDFNDDKKDAGELGAGHMVTAIYEIIPAGSSEAIASVDPLKYQKPLETNGTGTNEVMTIKFRYKEPKESKSKLLQEVVLDNKLPFTSASENCRFACAVAEFGMILRDSKFKGDTNYKDIIAMAKASKGTDDEGYRAEFIKLVEMAEMLKK